MANRYKTVFACIKVMGEGKSRWRAIKYPVGRKYITDIMVVIACYELSPLRELMKTTGQPYKVALRAMERTMRRGLIDYGTSIQVAFVTEKGRSMFIQHLYNGLWPDLPAQHFDCERRCVLPAPKK